MPFALQRRQARGVAPERERAAERGRQRLVAVQGENLKPGAASRRGS